MSRTRLDFDAVARELSARAEEAGDAVRALGQWWRWWRAIPKRERARLRQIQERLEAGRVRSRQARRREAKRQRRAARA